MKEFNSQTGGRYTYVDDIVNLQDLALAFGAIFDPDDNFVISGCEVSGNKLTDGYVWLGGKIRKFTETAWTAGATRYLYEVNSEETVPYASGDTKIGRKTYGCTLGSTHPSNVQYITFTGAGAAPRFREAFFGKYALLLETVNSSQTVNSPVSFSRNINVANAITTNDRVKVVTGSAVCQMFYDGTILRVQTQVGTGKTIQLSMSEDEGLTFGVNSNNKFKVSESLFQFLVPVSGSHCKFGNIVVEGNKIFNTTLMSDTAAIDINVTGYEGGTSHFRTTNIGNGKGSVMIEVNGKANTVSINSQTILNSSVAAGLILKSNLSKTNSALVKILGWHDSNNELIAHIGYSSSTAMFLEIKNNLGDVHIVGQSSVNIYPAIKENGVLLSEKYVLVNDYNTTIADKADADKVYAKTAADAKFAILNGGLTQFVNATKTKAVLCQEIGAAQSSDLSSYAAINKFLADMATDDAKKKKIRDNIGAVSKDDIKEPYTDTGWVQITDSSGAKTLYARQIGSIVCIQGTVKTIHSGVVFTLPNSISAPKYDVGYKAQMSNAYDWGCKIAGGKKTCEVVFCNAHGNTVSFSMTYMV